MKTVIISAILIFYSFLSFSQGKVKAIVIGVSEYQNLSTNKQLNFADADAISFYNYLKKLPNADTASIYLYTNSNANNRLEINLKITKTITEASPNDIIIIYFSGHGETQNNFNIDMGFLLLSTVFTNSDWYMDAGTLALKDLKEFSQLAAYTNKNMLIIADACHSGKVTEGDNAVKVLEVLKEDLTNSLKLVSCDIHQESYENEAWGGGHGMFTFHLLNGALGSADYNTDEWISFGELSHYISKKSKEDNKYHKIRQTPQFIGDSTVKLFKIKTNFLEDTLCRARFNPNSVNSTKGLFLNKGLFSDLEIDSSTQILIDSFYYVLKKGQLIDPYYYINDFGNNFSLKNTYLGTNFNEKKLIFTNNSKNIISTGNSTSFLISEYSLDSLNLIRQLKKHKAEITTYAISPDSTKLVVADEKNKIIIWDLINEKPQQKIKKAHKNFPEKIVFSHNGDYFASINQKELKIRYTQTGKIYKQVKLKVSKINDLLFLPNDKYIVAVAQDKSLIVYDIDSSSVVSTHKIHKKGINNIEISRNNLFFYTTNKHEFCAWDIHSQKQIYKQKIKNSAKIKVINKYLLYVYKGKMKIFDFVEKKEIKLSNIGDKFRVKQFFISSDNKIILVSTKKEILIADLIIPKLNPSAYFLIKQLGKTQISKSKLFDLKSALFVAINSKADKIINPLINGDNILLTEAQIDTVIRELNVSIELFPEYDFLIKKTISNILLLEAYKTISTNKSEQYELAILKLQQITEMNKFVTYPYNALGEIYLRQRKLDLADSMFNVAINRIPKWTEPQNNIGENYLLQKKYDKALLQYKNIIYLEPKLALGYNNIGKIYTDIGSYKKADEYFSLSLIADSTNAETYSLYAKLQIKRGRYLEAKTLLYKGLSINPNDYSTNKIAGNLFLFFYDKVNRKTENLRQSLNHFTKANESNPYNAESYTNLSNFYIKLLKYNDDSVYDFITDNCKEASNSVFLADIKIVILHLIEKLSSKALKLDPFSVDAYIGLAFVNSFGNDRKTILAYYQKAIDKDKSNPSAYYNLASFFASNKEYEKAIQYLKLAIDKDEKFLPAYMDLWNIYSEKGDFAALDNLYKRSTRVFYDSPIFFHKNASRKDKQSIGEIEKALEIDNQYLFAKISKDNIKFKNTGGKVVNLPEIDEEISFSFKRKQKYFDKYIVIEKDGKSGVILLDGSLAIQFNYDSIIGIDERTICAIKKDTTFYTETLYWFDTFGNILDYRQCNEFNYKESCFLLKNSNYKWGCFDLYNTQILDFKYDAIYPFYVKNKLIKVQSGDFYGCFNRKGKNILPIKYNRIEALNSFGTEGCRCWTLDNKIIEYSNTGAIIGKR